MRVRRARRLIVPTLAMLLVFASAAEASNWSRPFRLAGPQASDILVPQVAFSAGGQAAVAFVVAPEDAPEAAQAYVVIRAPGGRLGPVQRVRGIQQVLDLAFRGSALELLGATASGGRACCDSAGVIGYTRGAFRYQRLVAKLTGTTVGSLAAPVPGSLLATLAADGGVWLSRTGGGGRFGPARRLAGAGRQPLSVAATALTGGQTAVAWTVSPGSRFSNLIQIATGSAGALPGPARTGLRVPKGHQIDELGLAPGGRAATAAWTESWFDRAGTYHSQAVVADLPGSRARPLPVAGHAASGLSIAGDGHGDEVLAFKACDVAPTCSVWAAVRRPGRGFGAASRLGPIDPYEDPAVSISPTGQVLVGRISAANVLIAAEPRGARRFAPARVVAGASDASELAMAFGPRGQALAAWVEGLVAPTVQGAVYR